MQHVQSRDHRQIRQTVLQDLQHLAIGTPVFPETLASGQADKSLREARHRLCQRASVFPRLAFRRCAPNAVTT